MFFSNLVIVSLMFLASAMAQCNNGVAGTCQDYRYAPCQGAIRSSGGAPYYLTGYCPGDKYNKCCKAASGSNNNDPDPSNNGPVNNVPDPVSSGGGVFPVTSGSLRAISVNWGGSRSGGSRCHAGIDLYTSGAARIQAVAAGTVVSIMRGWYTCSGGSIDAIMIYHTSGPVAGKTINYGEINPGTYSLRVGSQVQAGTPIGTFTRCGMIHLELYNGRQTASQRWYPAGGSVGNAFNGCARNSLSTKPAALQDPRPLIRSLMPPGAPMHAGTSFLNDDADASFANDEAAIADAGSTDPDIDDGSSGTIAAIVVVVIVIIAIIVGVGIFFVLRRRSMQEGVVVSNSMYMQSAATPDMMTSARDNNSGGTIAPGYTNQGAAGSFTCSQCGKQYSFAEDLSQHVALRH